MIADRLAGYKRVRHVVMVDEIPRLPSGKALRRQLKEAWISDRRSQTGRDGARATLAISCQGSEPSHGSPPGRGASPSSGRSDPWTWGSGIGIA